ncbi:hypothetical protein BT63DRAFT_420012 [Microthyrium microscopicum]|uniref:Uncharacterized protein n=1 Tax=Microthyrium microscopicum TaxID=703497 RepID=A0A6A6UR02_9PEZI|nr:hypothetical protein BT63DRAFT_420012 [Microthyrium microscopicum]
MREPAGHGHANGHSQPNLAIQTAITMLPPMSPPPPPSPMAPTMASRSVRDLIKAHERTFQPLSKPTQDPGDIVRDVRDLYLHHRYKECITKALSGVPDLGPDAHPLHIAGCYFFAALSHDTQARHMPFRAPTLFPALDEALNLYGQAITTLTPPRPPPSPADPFCTTPTFPPRASSRWALASPFAIHSIRETSGDWGSTVPPTPATPMTPITPVSFEHKHKLLVQLSPAPSSVYSQESPERGAQFVLSAPPKRARGVGVTPTKRRGLERTGNVKVDRFNEGIAVFAEMVRGHVAKVERFRETVLEKLAEGGQ